MKNPYKDQRENPVYPSCIIVLSLLIACLLTACSAPKGLTGVWEADRQECLFKDTSGIFKNRFTEERVYILEFKGDNQVDLIYPNLKVFAELVVNQETQKEKEDLQCDVVFLGTYSYSILGSLEFNFANDETGAYQIQRGKNCDTDLKIEFKKLPAQSLYIGDPSVSVEKVDEENLHLAFSGFPKCKSDKMVTVFRRK